MDTKSRVTATLIFLIASMSFPRLSAAQTNCNCTIQADYGDVACSWNLPDCWGDYAAAQRVRLDVDSQTVWVESISWYLKELPSPFYQDSCSVSIYTDGAGLPSQRLASVTILPDDYVFYPQAMTAEFGDSMISLAGSSFWVAIESFDDCNCGELGCQAGIKLYSDAGGTGDDSAMVMRYYDGTWYYVFDDWGIQEEDWAWLVDVEYCTQLYGIQTIHVADEVSTNVVNHSPVVVWSLDIPPELQQLAYEFEVGLDDDWAEAELWNPPVMPGEDTAVQYAGLPLLDGETYIYRLRVETDSGWSEWCESSLRMNSLPTLPLPISPVADQVVSTCPTLWLLNSSDPEGDSLTYSFEVFFDEFLTNPAESIEGFPEGVDSTGWEVSGVLLENQRHWWRARTFDQFEYSIASGAVTFWVDIVPEPMPQAVLISPGGTSDESVFDLSPPFLWHAADDPDPFDTVEYRLELAMDSMFNFLYAVDNISDTVLTLNDSLAFQRRYWWRIVASDRDGFSVTSQISSFWTWTLGDIDNSHGLDISDLTSLVDCMFAGGACPDPLFVGDVDGSCTFDISDLTYMVAYLFGSGPAPVVGCE